LQAQYGNMANPKSTQICGSQPRDPFLHGSCPEKNRLSALASNESDNGVPKTGVLDSCGIQQNEPNHKKNLN
jgi:hypothetical protein